MVSKSEGVAIVGLGLIGGSFGKTLLKSGWPVYGFDPDPEAQRQAMSSGIEIFDSLSQLQEIKPGLVVLAGPLWTIPESAEQLCGLPGLDCLFAEFGSVKGSIVASIESLPAQFKSRFFPLHPMAGKESSGFLNSDDSLLVGAPWGLVEFEEQRDESLAQMISFLTSQFSARIFPVTAPNHDSAVALISQLPHLLANLLLASVGESSSRRLAFGLSAGSFRDGTRVAGTSPGRTAAMIMENSQNLHQMAEKIGSELISLASDLKIGKEMNLFDRAGAARAELDEYLVARGESSDLELQWSDFRPWFRSLLDSGSSITSLRVRDNLASVAFSH